MFVNFLLNLFSHIMDKITYRYTVYSCKSKVKLDQISRAEKFDT